MLYSMQVHTFVSALLIGEGVSHFFQRQFPMIEDAPGWHPSSQISNIAQSTRKGFVLCYSLIV